MSARFRPEDREKIKSRLTEFMKNLESEVPQAGMMTFLTAGDIYMGSLLSATVNALSPGDPSMVMDPIIEGVEALSPELNEHLAGTSPHVAICTLLLLLNEQIGAIETHPEDHPWVHKTKELIEALRATAREVKIH